MPGPDQIGHVGLAERDEQQAGLIHVAVVGVHHDDLHLGRAVRPAQPVRGERPAGASTQDDDAFHKIILHGRYPLG